MADVKISELSAVASIAGTEELEVNQGGTSKKATVNQILAAAALAAVTAFSGADTVAVGKAGTDYTFTGQSISFTGANSTDNTVFTVTNSSNAAAASHSIMDVAVGGTTSTGDPQVRWTIPSGTSWYAGVDNSASDVWILGIGTAVGTNALVTVSDGSGPDNQFLFSGSQTGTTNTFGLSFTSTLTVPAGGLGYGVRIAPTLVEAGSGTHAVLAALAVTPGTPTAGAANTTNFVGVYIDTDGLSIPTGTTNASGLKISGAPTGASTNYSLWSASGAVQLDFSNNAETMVLTVGNVNSGNATSAVLRFSTSNAASQIYLQAYGGSHATLANYFDINNRSNAPIRVLTNNAEHARFTAEGYFKASSSGTYRNATATYHEAYRDTNSGAEAFWVTNAAATATNQFGQGIQLAGDPNNTSNFFLFCQGNATERATIRSNGGLANFSANNVNLSDLTVKPYYESIGGEKLSAMWDAHRDTDWGLFKYADQTHDDLNVGYNAQDIEEKWATVAPWLVEQDKDGKRWVYQEDLHNAGHAILAEAQRRIEALQARVAELETQLASLQ